MSWGRWMDEVQKALGHLGTEMAEERIDFCREIVRLRQGIRHAPCALCSEYGEEECNLRDKCWKKKLLHPEGKEVDEFWNESGEKTNG